MSSLYSKCKQTEVTNTVISVVGVCPNRSEFTHSPYPVLECFRVQQLRYTSHLSNCIHLDKREPEIR